MSYYVGLPQHKIDCTGHPVMKTHFLIIVLFFTLSACGFHLRGSQQKTSVEISNVFVSNIGGESIAKEVKLQLAGAGARAVASVDEAKFVLRLEKEFFNRSVLSVSADTGKVEEYQLTLTVSLTLIDSKGKELIPGDEIRLVRDYTFDEDAVLGKFEEEKVLRDELVSQAASEIIRRLNAEAEPR